MKTRNFGKRISILLTVVLCFNLFVLCAGNVNESTTAYAASTTIQNDTFWKDTSGKFIYSQGGGVFEFNDTYYWYGVHYKGAETYAASPTSKNSDTAFVSVSCYSSKDLVNWKFENDVLTSNTKDFGWAYWVGRMGVAYNKNTKRYVLVTQYNDSILFASCDSPTGNFKVEKVQDQITNVLKTGTGDQTIFIDDDGKAYIICSNKGGRGHQYVCPLRESDYLYAEPATEVAKGYGREGNCLFKYKGKYYFCASDLHGWNSSHTYYMVSDNLMGPYSAWAVMPGTDEDFSHVTQTGFFVTVKGTKQETVLFCGDRWSDFAGNGIGYNQWCPLSFNGSNPIFNSLSAWDFNATTGEWSVNANNNYILNPSYDADRVSQTALAGWKNYGTGNSNASGAKTGRFCMQQWADAAFQGTMSQDIQLPNGTYTLKAWAKSSGGQKESKIYIKGYGGDEKSVSVKDIGDTWKEITISNIVVTNGTCQVGISSNGNAGNWVKVDDFSLIGTAAPPVGYTDGKYIKSLRVSDTENAADWSVQAGLKQGDAVFGDRAFTVAAIPEALTGAEWIRSACDSKKFTGEEASFVAGENITVYVGLDERVTAIPDWMNGWAKTAQTIRDNGDPVVSYRVYKKNFARNDNVTLGTLSVANAVNYMVMAKLAAEDTTTAFVEQRKGDMNNDGVLTAFDLLQMKKGMMQGFDDTAKAAADLNADGVVNQADVQLMRDYLVGRIQAFTVA